MLSITLFSLFSFRFVYNVGMNERDFFAPISYGFEIGGNYTIRINNGLNDRILLHIGIIDDIKQFWIVKDGYNPCNNALTDIENIHIVQNENSTISGSIRNPGKYTINVKSCKYFSSNYTLEIIFLNPTSNLSSENQNYFKIFENLLFLSIFI